MKYVVTAIMALCIAGCGTYSKQDVPGPMGIQGNPGASGAPGPQGPAGQDGSNGSDGVNGSNGTNGTNGSNGAPGLGSIPGIQCTVYELSSYNVSTQLPDALVGSTLVGNFILPAFNIPNSLATNGFPGMPSTIQNVVGYTGYALDCYGYLNIETSGDDYVFSLLSDDGSQLRINDVTVISNQGEHVPSSVSSSTLYMDKGLNKINIVYFQGPLTQIALQLSMSGANYPNQVIPAAQYTH